MHMFVIKVALNTVTGVLKKVAHKTDNRVDDTIIREFDRMQKKVMNVLK